MPEHTDTAANGYACTKDCPACAAQDNSSYNAPWTPGPWTDSYATHTVSPQKHTITGPGRNSIARSRMHNADASLITLAPEMAAAILTCAEWMTETGPLSNSLGVRSGIIPLADKLRQIHEKGTL